MKIPGPLNQGLNPHSNVRTELCLWPHWLDLLRVTGRGRQMGRKGRRPERGSLSTSGKVIPTSQLKSQNSERHQRWHRWEEGGLDFTPKSGSPKPRWPPLRAHGPATGWTCPGCFLLPHVPVCGMELTEVGCSVDEARGAGGGPATQARSVLASPAHKLFLGTCWHSSPEEYTFI